MGAATALAETVWTATRESLQDLPPAQAQVGFGGIWPQRQPAVIGRVIHGDLDACRVGDAGLDGCEQLAALQNAGKLHEVDGAFHLAAAATNELVLARDAIGHKSLYYARKPNDEIAYASELRDLVGRGAGKPVLDSRAIAAYLACAYVPGQSTLFAGVRELLPGHALHAQRDAAGQLQLQEKPYFHLPAEADAASYSELREHEAIRGLRELLERAVAHSAQTEQPAAAFLSGGIDSSVIVALVQQQRAQAGGTALRTLSIAFGADYKNELEFSSLVARHVGSEHTIVHLTPDAILASLDETHALLSSPIGDPLTVPNAILFRKARESAQYVWNGEGGDPCFGGPKNLPMVLAELYGDGENAVGERHARARSYYRAHLKCFDELSTLLTPDALAAVAADPLEREVTHYFEKDASFVGALSAINVIWKGGHHILPKVEKLAAAVGIRPRSPLFSKLVVEFASRLPPNLRLRGSVEKYALKQAVRGLLPDSIIDRPKSGMMVPVEGWFQGPLLPLARERLLGGVLPFDVLRKSAIEALLDGKIGGLRPRRGVKIWLLVALESYLRQFAN
jgi:asparagine synthase (glutamine-hydrolysing)